MTDNDPNDLSSQPTTGWRSQPPLPPDQPTTQISQPTVASSPQTAAQPPARPLQPPASNVQPSSSGWGQSGRAAPQPPPPTSAPRPTSNIQRPTSNPGRPASKDRGYRALKALFFVGLLGVVLLVLALAVSVVGYVSIASALPSPDELEKKAINLFTSSQIYDRDGNLLYELIDPNGGRRTTVPLTRISPWLTRATIATEDPRFYNHPGFDLIGIARAIIQNIREGDMVSGASTIAQQVVRSLVLPEGTERTLSRKIREAVLAAEVTRSYPRDKILEIYVNSINYGNLAYGVEAASRTYFNKDAAELTLAEASLLAGIPQSPAVYDPFTPEGKQYTLARQKSVLRLMRENGDITTEQEKLAAQAMENYIFTSPPNEFTAKAPHWVVYIKQLVEQEFGAAMLYRGGLKIYTTLDPKLQQSAEGVVREQIAALADKHVTNAGLIALEPATGKILAMVGSADFNDEAISGQVNMTLRPRQTGSVIKPLTYLAAFEKGWNPATVLWDIPVSYTDTAGNVYQPRNYDGKFHGPQSIRSSLANSYNIPAVKALVDVTIPEFLKLARRLGIDTLTRPDYGPALTLGGGEVPLIEMTGAFQPLANNGTYMPPIAIERVEKADGTLVCKFTPIDQNAQGVPLCQTIDNTGVQLVRPEHAYLITNILADNDARTPAFGPNSVLRLSRPAAVKTGTTNDYRDNWTIGYTPDLLTGVWVGNADNTEMQGISGVTGAGPIWHNFMEAALADRLVIDFVRPAGVVEMEVCADSGTQPSQYCPNRKREIFFVDQPPAPADQDWYQQMSCGGDQQVRIVLPDDAFAWASQQPEWQALPIASKSQCGPAVVEGGGTIVITTPGEGTSIAGVIPIIGTVAVPQFSRYELTFGAGWGPNKWDWISGPHEAQVTNGQLGEWNVGGLNDGEYTLRITVYADRRTDYTVRVRVQNSAPIVPTAIPTEVPPLPTVPPTETPLPTATPEPSATPEPTITPTPTATPFVSPLPIP
ncbi:MAG: transglycosylase domain-containing protein [Chloroflexi bacterium]|nr:transglycosylase domain-containing protein [Chloroflexota bacterium]